MDEDFDFLLAIVAAFILCVLAPYFAPIAVLPRVHDAPEVALLKIYQQSILPIERAYELHRFGVPEVLDAQLGSLPMVLLLGQYSAGKSSFLKNMIGMDYPGIHIGHEPTTDKFVAIMHGNTNQTLDGSTVITRSDLPFTGLDEKFGESFLRHLGGAEVTSEVLRQFHFMDTPGVRTGQKLRAQRGYDFTDVASWFAERADMILLFCDATKLDLSDEFQELIRTLLPRERKVRWVLNKADDLGQRDLMQVYGQLRGSMTNIFKSVEKARVYMGSFRDGPLTHPEHTELFARDRGDLMSLFDRLPLDTTMRKIAMLKCRVRRIHAHFRVMQHIHAERARLFSPDSATLVAQLPVVYERLQRAHGLSSEDFPETYFYASLLQDVDSGISPLQDIDEGVYATIGSALLKIREVVNRLVEVDVDHLNSADEESKEAPAADLAELKVTD